MYRSCDFSRALKNVLACLSILVAVSFSAQGQTPAGNVPQSLSMETAARGELNLGVEAYKSAHYEEAIVHFQKATELATDLLMAKRYLATALAQNVVPGPDTPENMKVAQQAIDIFGQVLVNEPHDVNSMKQVAGIYFSVKKLEDAKTWQKKVLDEEPNDPEAAYTIGVIDWTEAHINTLKAFLPIGISDDGMGNVKAPAAVMKDLKAQNGALVEEALEYLHQAVENRPDYDDAMAYMNLVYRRKADGDWDDEAARKDDLAKAEEWRNKAMNARKANEEKKIERLEPAQP